MLLLAAGNFATQAQTVTGPAGISTGLKTWLDASDPDADGNSSNNPANSTALNTWKDKSGSGNDGVNLTANGGAYRSDATSLINGHPVVRFASTNVYKFANIDLRAISNPDITIITVYKQGNAGRTGLWGNDDGNWDRFMYTAFNGQNGIASRGPGQSPPNTDITGSGVPGNLYLFTGVYDGDVVNGVNNGTANGSAFYFNGSLLGTFTDKTEASLAQTTLRLGFDGDDGYFNGDVAEFIVYNRVLTACEIQQINSYLSSKYGVTFTTATVTPGGATSFCPGGSVTLTANAGLSYQWYQDNVAITGAVSRTYTASASGSYHVVVTSANCATPAASAAVVVTVKPNPVVVAGSNSPVGIGNSLNLTASGATTYSWSGPNSFSSTLQNPTVAAVTAAAAGTYTVTGTTNGCTGTASVPVQIGVPAGALHFDGVDDYVNLGDNIEGFGAVTFEAWIYRNSSIFTDFDEICSKEVINSFSVQNWDSRLHVNFGNGSGWGNATSSNSVIPFNTWTHVAATRDASGNVKIYINGQPDGSGFNNQSGSNSALRAVGFKPGQTFAQAGFNGNIEELRIWNRALCQGEIQNNMNCELAGTQSGSWLIISSIRASLIATMRV